MQQFSQWHGNNEGGSHLLFFHQCCKSEGTNPGRFWRLATVWYRTLGYPTWQLWQLWMNSHNQGPLVHGWPSRQVDCFVAMARWIGNFHQFSGSRSFQLSRNLAAGSLDRQEVHLEMHLGVGWACWGRWLYIIWCSQRYSTASYDVYSSWKNTPRSKIAEFLCIPPESVASWTPFVVVSCHAMSVCWQSNSKVKAASYNNA